MLYNIFTYIYIYVCIYSVAGLNTNTTTLEGLFSSLPFILFWKAQLSLNRGPMLGWPRKLADL